MGTEYARVAGSYAIAEQRKELAMPSSWPAWILRGLGDEQLLVQPFDAPRPPRYVILPPMFVVGYLERWLFEADSRRVLIDIYATVFGGLGLRRWGTDEIERCLRPA